MAVLLITHDLGVVRNKTDRVNVITGGKIVECGPTERVFTAPQHAYTQKLLASEPKGRALGAPKDGPMVMDVANLRVWFPIKRGLLRKVVGHVKAVDGIDVAVRER